MSSPVPFFFFAFLLSINVAELLYTSVRVPAFTLLRLLYDHGRHQVNLFSFSSFFLYLTLLNTNLAVA